MRSKLKHLDATLLSLLCMIKLMVFWSLSVEGEKTEREILNLTG